MDKSYEPHAIEQRWYKTWEDNGYFAPEGATPDSAGSYCIMIPPPNVTGSLHMGHGFNNTVMDTLVRYHRMRGFNTLWQPGTDHAGIATQMVVERQLNAAGKSRHDLGREKFIERVWEWKGESGGNITRQLRRLGSSLDWSHERFTMDEGLSDAVKEVFVRLHEEGLIYRGKRLVNWDPVLHTAVSDLEVISEEEQGYLWHFRYPLSDGSGHLVVATTRPETMLGDTAVAVNPNDERYQHLIGKSITLPLVGREIPIIADDYVDPAFGTGCVKITPAHDFNDYAMGLRHNLPFVNVMNPDATIRATAQVVLTAGAVLKEANGNVLTVGGGDTPAGTILVTSTSVPEHYAKLDRYEARDIIVRDMNDQGLLEKIDDHKLMVPRGDRSGSVIEPYLTDQWFVDLTRDVLPDGRPGGKKAITEPALGAVRNGDIRFIPQNWENTYFQWLENIQDWCISRQIWWGHRIPAWYDEQGNVYVARDKKEAYKKYFDHIFHDSENEHQKVAQVFAALTSPDYDGLDVYAKSIGKAPLRQDDDVLDTWFSSALWPFSTLGWPENTARLQQFYPTSVLVTGFDIIFFWVARMIMMGMKFMDGQVPFKDVYIHGLVRDAHGQKMSKSKGNVLDPIDLIDGIDLESLVKKRTSGLMQPEMAKKIEKATRAEFPDGIKAYGTDALRFTFAALASTGRDINFDTGRIEGYRNFCNKLWNAARYVLMNTEGKDCGVSGGAIELSLADRWITARLDKTIAAVNESISGYRFDHAAQAIYDFTWNEYCDWYLELSKPVLTSGDASEAQQRGTRQTLVRVLEALLRLAHPIMPYITEEIWQRVAPLTGAQGETIMRQSYPQAGEFSVDASAEGEMQWVMDFIIGIRKIRSGMNIPPSKALPVLLQNGSSDDQAKLQRNELFLQRLARTESLTWLKSSDEAPESAVALVGEMKLLVPMAGLIDKEAELARLTKEIGKLEIEIEKLAGRLANDNFVAKAPAELVEKEKGRLNEMRVSLGQLTGQKAKIERL